MTNFDDMTAMVHTAQARTASRVRKGAAWNGFALPDIEQHCGRSFARGRCLSSAHSPGSEARSAVKAPGFFVAWYQRN